VSVPVKRDAASECSECGPVVNRCAHYHDRRVTLVGPDLDASIDDANPAYIHESHRGYGRVDINDSVRWYYTEQEAQTAFDAAVQRMLEDRQA
jgi:hypothetical protein